jgi:hypothetical protein
MSLGNVEKARDPITVAPKKYRVACALDHRNNVYQRSEQTDKDKVTSSFIPYSEVNTTSISFFD